MRWNISSIAFYGEGDLRRVIDFDSGSVNIISGDSGTGKSAIVDAIDFCLGSEKCKLPWYVRRHARAVAVRWQKGDLSLISARKIPSAGSGTGQMFVRFGKSLELAKTFLGLEGATPKDKARQIIERAFGIEGIESTDLNGGAWVSRATVRNVTPYLFLSDGIIVSKDHLFHDINRADKARDIISSMPYFLGAIDHETVFVERKLRRLEAQLDRLERDAKAEEKSRSQLTSRALAILRQAAAVDLASRPDTSSDEGALVKLIEKVSQESPKIQASDFRLGGELLELEEERRALVMRISELRQFRATLERDIKQASGFEGAISGQMHKLLLAEHLNVGSGVCPVCASETDAGRKMMSAINKSLNTIRGEFVAIDQLNPELLNQREELTEKIDEAKDNLKSNEAQLRALIQQSEEFREASNLEHARAIVIGRAKQFLETTIGDYSVSLPSIEALRDEILELRARTDPEARMIRLRHAENMISAHATRILSELPTEVPARNASILFSSSPKISIIEPSSRAALTMVEVGSDQNYLSMHISLAFAMQQHFEEISAPVPGVIVIDQISRPYYPKGGEEKSLSEMKRDNDKVAMRKIVDFLFKEVQRRSGLQVILIEHAYIEENSDYVRATKERWTSDTGLKLIPDTWPALITS